MGSAALLARHLGIAALLALAAAPLAADEARDALPFYPPDADFDPDVPRPQDLIGHPLGHRIARNDMLNAYLARLGEVSERVHAEVIAHSHEGRPVMMLTITTPQNHRNLEQIRRRHLQGISGGDADADAPLVLWLNYGVHGAEVSSTDAILPVAYHLAAARGGEIERMLDNTVIILIGSFNPDGSNRQSSWNHIHGARVPVSDPRHRLHRTFWPGGRTNHYWFDLNRQWLLQQHPEPQGWVRQFHRWRPHILADYHEMGSPDSTYYFHPGVPGRTYQGIPARSMELLEELASHPRRFMDAEARLYFHEERFDNFYIGKGSTYPHMHGSIGILFEQAHTDGFKDSPYGILSLRDNIRTHYRTSLDVISGGLDMRAKLLAWHRQFAADAARDARADPVKAHIFQAPGDPALLHHALELLQRHRIEVRTTARAHRVAGREFAAGALIVRTGQPQYRLIKALFEAPTEFQSKIFYDVSAWTMPLAFGLDHAALRSVPGSLVGAVAPPAALAPAPMPGAAQVAYIFPWRHYYAPRALGRLLDAGIRPRVATKPVRISHLGRTIDLGRGAIMVPVGWQGGDADRRARLRAVLQDIARKDGITIYHMDSSWTSQTPGMDAGSGSFAAVRAPRVLLAVGDGINAYDAGEVWHLLDYRMQMATAMVDLDRISARTLAGYSHLVLPGGNYGRLGKRARDDIDQWIRGGGTLVGIRQGASFAHRALMGGKSAPGEGGMGRIPYGDKEQREGEQIIGGAIMAGDLDISHPIGYGYASTRLASHRNTRISFAPTGNPFAAVVRIADEPLLAGYASAENRRALAGRTMLMAERHGRGSIILFADNPNFRGWFYGTNKLFMNSLYFSTLFDN